MGIQGQGSLLFKSAEIEFNNIVYLIEQRHAERRSSTSRVRPKVTMDASLIGYKFLGTNLHPSNGVHLIATALAIRNIDVLIVCDPPTRHHSKRAHQQRVGKKETERLKLMLLRIELSSVGDDAEKIRYITNAIRKLEKMESRSFLPENFIPRLEQLVSAYKSGEKGEITVETSPFQADPSIADIALRGGCEAIFSGDSDFAMYVGPGGPDTLSDIVFRDIKINTKQSTISCGTIITGQQHVAMKVEEILSHKGVKNVFPAEPKYPLFSGVHNPKIRALIALALGCDALPGGVPGVGAKSLHDLLGTCNLDSSGMYVELASKITSQKKAVIRDPQALLCLANSLIYEKTTSEIGYMYDPPASIEKYNEAFAAAHTEVLDGPAMIICKGCNGRHHAFLEAEGVSLCAMCNASLCRYCVWEDEPNEDMAKVLCLDCKRYCIAGSDDDKTEREMRDFLREHSVNVPVAATYAEVKKLFHHFDDDDHAIFANDISTVKYPLLPTSTLNMFHESSKDLQRMQTVTLRDIGLLIRSADIDAGAVFGLVHLLGSLVDIPSRKKGEILSSKHAVPHNLVDMARNARVHTSQRLIERGLRHATDRASPDILDGQITLARCNTSDLKGDVCVIIDNKVRASMKNVEYETKSAITHKHFLASECNCRAGCSNKPSPDVALDDIGNGKIICSHGMTLPISLSLAMFRGLAAHVLSELRLRLMREDLKLFDKQTLTLLRADVSRLMKAAGHIDREVPDGSMSILQSLEIFSVGTELPKKLPSPPKSHDLGLLREKCCYERCTKMAENTVSMKNEENLVSDVSINLATTMVPTINEVYLSSQIALDALSVLFGSGNLRALIDTDNEAERLPIGFELLRERAVPHLMKQEYNERNTATMEVANQLNIALLHLTKERARSCKIIDLTTAPKPATTSKKRKANGNTQPSQPSHKSCCVDGCTNGHHAKLKRVTEYPPELPEDASNDMRKTYAKKRFIREERTERLAFGRNCKFKELRACEEHWKPIEGKKTMYKHLQKDGKEITKTFSIPTFFAPVRIGTGSFVAPPTTFSRGNATDRATLRHVREICENADALAQQQLVEMQDVKDGEQHLGHINPTILSAVGLDVHCGTGTDNNDVVDSSNQSENTSNTWRAPTILLKDVVPKEVKRRTGFHDLKMLLSFVAVVCGGDTTIMTSTTSILTWLEEWILCFEFVWGRTTIRYTDYATTYCCREQTLRNVIKLKLKRIIAGRNRWPMYASYAEDAKFRDGEMWSGHFDPSDGERVVMHDSTNIPLAQPSNAALQRALYNSYYGMCCAKGGVAVQLCGYIYGLPLCTGHSDDTRCIDDTLILEKQNEFVESDDSSKRPFLNVFDKGYQCVISALKNGQHCLQPAFAESEKQFKDKATLYSGAVAVVRSGNERAVNRCKMSWFIKRGARDQMWNIDLVCDVWDAWTFQVNFMYDTFL